MKTIIEEIPGLREPEVIIRCEQADDQIRRVQAMVQAANRHVPGLCDGKNYIIPLGEILYFETVDKRTFFYTKTQVLECSLRLYEVESVCAGADFFRASKSAIVNLQKVRSIRPVFGAKAEIELENDEKLIVSRQYYPGLKRILIGE